MMYYGEQSRQKVLNEEQLEDVAGGHHYSDKKGHDFDACIAAHN